MARKALKIKLAKMRARANKEYAAGKKITKSTRLYHRCTQCGRIHRFMRRFDICGICFRELASQGKIMGVKKSSW